MRLFLRTIFNTFDNLGGQAPRQVQLTKRLNNT